MQLIKYSCVAVIFCATAFSYAQTSPAFDCTKIEKGSIEAMICEDAELITLDNKMTAVYTKAAQKAVNEHPPVLKAEQRGWIKGRNECWKSDNKRACVLDAYRLRIAELQARYRLVNITATTVYQCSQRAEVIVNYFETEPKTAIAEYGDSVSMMYIQTSASGTKYQGRNETLWEHDGQAKITWGYESPEMNCTAKPGAANTHP